MCNVKHTLEEYGLMRKVKNKFIFVLSKFFETIHHPKKKSLFGTLLLLFQFQCKVGKHITYSCTRIDCPQKLSTRILTTSTIVKYTYHFLFLSHISTSKVVKYTYHFFFFFLSNQLSHTSNLSCSYFLLFFPLSPPYPFSPIIFLIVIFIFFTFLLICSYILS